MPTTFAPAKWNIWQKIAFRFFFVFFVSYIILEPNGTILLQGLWKKDTIRVRLVKMDIGSFPLLNHDFHWVSETGYNR